MDEHFRGRRMHTRDKHYPGMAGAAARACLAAGITLVTLALGTANAEELVAQGVFADRKRADQFAEHLDALHADPTLREIACELGIGSAVLDERVRTREIENWLAQVVIPGTNA